MKRHQKLIVAGCSAFALAASFLFPDQSHGQPPAAAPAPAVKPAAAPAVPVQDDTAEINAVIGEIAAQHAQLVAGQATLDQRLGVIEENVRLARIFASRSGGGK